MVAVTRSVSRSKSAPVSPKGEASRSPAKAKRPSTSSARSDRWPLVWFIYGALFLALEFGLKYAAYHYPPSMRLFTIGELVYVQLCSVINPDSAMSMLRGVPDWGKHALMAFSVLALMYVTYQQIVSPTSTRLTRRGVFCLIIGAIGNGPDRLLVGGVVDYIFFETGGVLGPYALAWNISDLMINFGLANVILSIIRDEEGVAAKKSQ